MKLYLIKQLGTSNFWSSAGWTEAPWQAFSEPEIDGQIRGMLDRKQFRNFEVLSLECSCQGNTDESYKTLLRFYDAFAALKARLPDDYGSNDSKAIKDCWLQVCSRFYQADNALATRK